MEETKATAHLPNLDIEIVHRRLPEEEAEQLAVSLKASPSFAAFARFLELQPAAPWLAFQPWIAWQRMALLAWQPWLAAWTEAPPAEQSPGVSRRLDAPAEGS